MAVAAGFLHVSVGLKCLLMLSRERRISTVCFGSFPHSLLSGNKSDVEENLKEHYHPKNQEISGMKKSEVLVSWRSFVK